MGFLPGVRDSSENVAGAALERQLRGGQSGLAQYGKRAAALNEESVHACTLDYLMRHPGVTAEQARVEVLLALVPRPQQTQYQRPTGHCLGHEVCVCEQGQPCRCSYATATGGGWGTNGNKARYAKPDPRAECEELITELKEVLLARADTLDRPTRLAIEKVGAHLDGLFGELGLNEPPVSVNGLGAAY